MNAQDAAVAMSAMWALGMFTTALVLAWRAAYPPEPCNDECSAGADR